MKHDFYRFLLFLFFMLCFWIPSPVSGAYLWWLFWILLEHGISKLGPRVEPPAHNTWEFCSTSIASLIISMNDLHPPIDINSISLESLDNRHSSGSSCIKIRDGSNLISEKTSNESRRCHGMRINLRQIWSFYLNLIHIHRSPKCQVIEDAEKDLKGDDQLWHSLSSKNFIEPLIRFLKDACGQHDVKAQRVRSQLLLELVNKIEMVGRSYMGADAFNLMTPLLNSKINNIVTSYNGKWLMCSLSPSSLWTGGPLFTRQQDIDNLGGFYNIESWGVDGLMSQKELIHGNLLLNWLIAFSLPRHGVDN